MKICYMSDIHNEFSQRSLNIFDDYNNDADVLVIAGDLNVGARNVARDLKTIKEIVGIKIVYVPGNHEFYDSSYRFEKTIFDKIKDDLLKDDIYILDNDAILIDDINFIGIIGWPDHSFNKISYKNYPRYSDFKLIYDFDMDHKQWADDSIKFIEKALLHDNVNVIVMHWLPTPECISAQYIGNLYNPCFTNDWKTKLNHWTKKQKYNIRAIIHGHSHDLIKTKHGNIHLLRNPIGYPHEGIRFNINEVITI